VVVPSALSLSLWLPGHLAAEMTLYGCPAESSRIETSPGTLFWLAMLSQSFSQRFGLLRGERPQAADMSTNMSTNTNQYANCHECLPRSGAIGWTATLAMLMHSLDHCHVLKDELWTSTVSEVYRLINSYGHRLSSMLGRCFTFRRPASASAFLELIRSKYIRSMVR
jgi:hypothetical protein